MAISGSLTVVVIVCLFLVGIPAIFVLMKIRKMAKCPVDNNCLLHSKTLPKEEAQQQSSFTSKLAPAIIERDER